MAAAGGGEEDARQVLRMDTDCPGNGQCAELLHRGEELWETPDPESQKTPAGREMLGCLREGTMRLCWALFRFCNQNFIGEFFFLHKIWTHPWKCPECGGMPQHLQRPSACICVYWKGEAPHQGKHKGIFLVLGDADAVGSQAVASGSPSFQRH